MGIKVYNSLSKVKEDPGDNFIDGFLGTNKTGKSTTAKKVAEIWRGSHDDSMEIFGYDYQRVFGGLIPRNNLIDPEDKDWALKLCKKRNCLVLLDEIRLLCPDLRHPPKGLAKLFSQCFFWNMSIIWTTHNPMLVPDVCTFHTTIYHLFFMYARQRQFHDKIPDASLCITGSNRVNKYVRKYGKGKHKLDKAYDGQGFAYCKVDTISQKLTFVNMNKPL